MNSFRLATVKNTMIIYVHSFRLCQPIDKKKKKKKMSSMNKSCEKKQQQHILKIFYMWMFCITLKGRNTKRFVQNWHSPSHLRQNGHDFV